MNSTRLKLIAYILPFAVFLAFIALEQLLGAVWPDSDSWKLAAPKYWLYPLQTIVCGSLLLVFWKNYTFRPLSPWFLGALAGLITLAVWISPQIVFGASPRTEGFDPEALGSSGPLYLLTVIARFARLVIIVPLLEEIFWRGFLMRYLVKEDFTSVAFGTYRPLAFFGTAALFMLEHSSADWPAALITGLLFNIVAVRTKSLFACVVAHAVTNAGLGIYIMATRQWGFW